MPKGYGYGGESASSKSGKVGMPGGHAIHKHMSNSAFMKKETADFSAITTWGVFYPNEDSPANLILLDCISFDKNLTVILIDSFKFDESLYQSVIITPPP